jgi:hypothetical protein
LVAAISVARPARGDELRFTLSYQAPAECPSAEAIQSAVRRLVTAQTKPYSASVVIEREPSQFAARIVANDGSERTLVGSSCDELAEAVAVVLALAISPSSAPPKATTTKNGSSETSAPAPLHPPPHESTGSSRRVQLKLGAAGVLDLGTMPKLDWGISGRVGASARAWSAALEGAYWLRPERETLAQNPDIGGDFSWWLLAALGCFAARDGAPRFELCAGPELGHLAGHGFGFPGAHDAARFRFGFQAMGEAQLPVSARLRLRAGLGVATVVIGRHAFYIGGTELYRPQLLAGRAQFGADVIF